MLPTDPVWGLSPIQIFVHLSCATKRRRMTWVSHLPLYIWNFLNSLLDGYAKYQEFKTLTYYRSQEPRYYYPRKGNIKLWLIKVKRCFWAISSKIDKNYLSNIFYPSQTNRIWSISKDRKQWLINYSPRQVFHKFLSYEVKFWSIFFNMDVK